MLKPYYDRNDTQNYIKPIAFVNVKESKIPYNQPLDSIRLIFYNLGLLSQKVGLERFIVYSGCGMCRCSSVQLHVREQRTLIVPSSASCTPKYGLLEPLRETTAEMTKPRH